MMVVAAGNGGSACSTVSDPPAFYAESYTVGALTTGTDTIAGFSSRGPVTVDGSNRIKPDISAPGTNTRSADNTGDTCYTTASGTSMATPHIAGAMALLWSAIPSLQHQIDASRDALNNSAVFISSTQCGTAGPPNNVYGWGRVDILGSCERSITHANAYSYTRRTPQLQPAPLHGYSDSHRYSYRYTDAQTDAYAQVCADTEASSYTATETIEIFADRKNLDLSTD